MGIRVHTGISRAFCCERDGKWTPIKIPAIQRRNPHASPEVAWFDVLLDGGLVLPRGMPVPPKRGAKRKKQKPLPGRALNLLITGPPGSGKTTLALELCRRLRTAACVSDDGKSGQINLPSLYITSEASKEWVHSKAADLGWPLVDENGVDTALPGTLVLDREDVSMKEANDLLLAVADIFQPVQAADVVSALHKKWREWRKVLGPTEEEDPEIVVIDSLNTLRRSSRGDFFDGFMRLLKRGPRLIVTVLDSPDEAGDNAYWAYFADVVLRLDWDYDHKYMVRTFEIQKARYQQHVWGRHKLKIYGPTDPAALTDEDRRRAHPYRAEGGIFVYPSIHYYLSLYKKHSPHASTRGPVSTSLDALDDLLRGGLPRGRCTGMLGLRGGHKSHLAYRAILSAIQESPSTRGLIISLRDDSIAVQDTLSRILIELGKKNERTAKRHLESLQNSGRLEILYFPPGYITPEEFFHKLMMSLHNLRKREDDEVIALFNSLDQLGARFPLCANEQNFIPGIIEVMSGEGVTSWFVAVEEDGQPPEQYGLMSMADALLSFRRHKVPCENYVGHVGEHLQCYPQSGTPKTNSPASLDSLLSSTKTDLPERKQVVVVRVVRYAGGQPAGRGGFLELVEKGSAESQLLRPGLSFVEFSHLHPEPSESDE